MRIGVPREIKDNELRVALTPFGAEALARAGHAVAVERGAGAGSGFADEEYAAAGATLVAAADAWAADLVIKVKEPLPAEYDRPRAGQILFTYLHLAAEPALARALLDRGVSAIAYETVQLPDGSLPLLTPMSEVAGRMAPQVAARFLTHVEGGRGKLLAGVPGVAPARLVVLGGGTVGANAVRIALGMGAQVTLFDTNLDRLRRLDATLTGRLTTLASTPRLVAEAVAGADAVIGAVLVAGARAPRVVTAAMVAAMPRGAVIVDVAVDQGGCVETIHPTTHRDPVYLQDGVVHYGVTNLPGAVPRTSTMALTNATLPYVAKLAAQGLAALAADPALACGLNIHRGTVTHAAVAEALNLPVGRFPT